MSPIIYYSMEYLKIQEGSLKMVQPSNPFDQQKKIPGVKHIIAVSSGKGGVGKSTVATNLAMALSKKAKVGLLDADIYGPSIPRMMGAVNQKPQITENNKILPLVRYGMKLMSIGFMIDEQAAVVWRGPMLFKAMDQFFRDGHPRPRGVLACGVHGGGNRGHLVCSCRPRIRDQPRRQMLDRFPSFQTVCAISRRHRHRV